MAAIRLLELLILLAMLSGFLGLLLHRNLFLKVLSMDVLGSAVVALFVLVAARTGLRSPILSTPDAGTALSAIFLNSTADANPASWLALKPIRCAFTERESGPGGRC